MSSTGYIFPAEDAKQILENVSFDNEQGCLSIDEDIYKDLDCRFVSIESYVANEIKIESANKIVPYYLTGIPGISNGTIIYTRNYVDILKGLECYVVPMVIDVAVEVHEKSILGEVLNIKTYPIKPTADNILHPLPVILNSIFDLKGDNSEIVFTYYNTENIITSSEIIIGVIKLHDTRVDRLLGKQLGEYESEDVALENLKLFKDGFISFPDKSFMDVIIEFVEDKLKRK